MGRPPCCDKVGIKKGPWTPEEDIILVSYIQEHGPGNWRAVPTNTGLLRCSKSCRLRWTNYLRPGIKRGNFTPHEEGMIIHLQALLGNKWAAIATYLPQRTDNDIKNYWNTHLKKKLKKFQQHSSPPPSSSFDHRPAQQHHYQIMASPSDSSNYHHLMSKGYGETIGPAHNNEGNNKHENHSSSSSSVYASSAENISRLLEGWMRSSSSLSPPMANNTNSNFNVITATSSSVNENRDNISSSIQCNYRPQQMIENDQGPNNVGVSSDDRDQLEGILSFDHHRRNSGFEKYSSCDSSQKGSENSNNGLIDHEKDRCAANIDREKAKMDDVSPPLSFLEKWLLDESAVQGEGVMELSSIF